MLSIDQLSLQIQAQTVLQDITLSFESGKNYCILGKNGSGKSSLALGIMWHPAYEVTQGQIVLDGINIVEQEPNDRAQAGVFLAFQNIPQIQGVKLFEFLRTIYNTKHDTTETFVSFKKIILPYLAELDIPKDFLWRDLNVWFSGGERRKIEILQLKLLQPRYIFLDEVDSWLDVDAFKQVATLLQEHNTPDNSLIIITHYFNILDYIPIDHVYVLDQGKLMTQGNTDIANSIRENWFESLTTD